MTFCFRLKQQHPGKKKNQKDVLETEAANPSSDKMTTVTRVIGLKGMPMGKTLVGSFSQPRDHRLPKRKQKTNKRRHMLNTVPLHLLLPIAKQRQSRSPIQNKSLLLITQSLTLVRTRGRDVPCLTTHPALPLQRWSRV